MSYDIILLKIARKVSFFHSSLLLQLVSVLSVLLQKGISEKLHICTGSPNILLNFLPDYIIFEILVPH